MTKYLVVSAAVICFLFLGCANQDDSPTEDLSASVLESGLSLEEEAMEPVVIEKSVVAEVKEASVKPAASETSKKFIIYTEKSSRDNHYIPSGFMGDYSDIRMNLGAKDDPHSGEDCIEFVYLPKRSQGAGWAGVYWLNPANNWGTIDGGYDLSGSSKLNFWARGKQGGETIQEFKVGGIYGKHSDSDTAGIGPAVLSKEWTEYSIPLDNKDLTYIIGGFVWSTNLDSNPEGATFYLDDIAFE
ncbi:MAG: hypothetical protein ISS27_01765 [Candidatus Omnitrophica bacterium]|nr:hypothetical protein [Candidatus Omnitrophota bacterium]